MRVFHIPCYYEKCKMKHQLLAWHVKKRPTLQCSFMDVVGDTVCSKSICSVPVVSEFTSDSRQKGTWTFLGNSSANNSDRSNSEEFTRPAHVAGELNPTQIKRQGSLPSRMFLLQRAHFYKCISQQCPGVIGASQLVTAKLAIGKTITQQPFRDSHHGFINGKWCLANPVAFHGSMTEAVDKGRSTDVISLFFCEAFDMVPHNILTSKRGLLRELDTFYQCLQ